MEVFGYLLLIILMGTFPPIGFVIGIIILIWNALTQG